MSDPVPILLTVTEAAKLLGRDRKTLYRWIELGTLHPTRMNGRNYISRGELDRLEHRAS